VRRPAFIEALGSAAAARPGGVQSGRLQKKTVMPAKAGIQGHTHRAHDSWIPAFAGMTVGVVAVAYFAPLTHW
jgi:hypothetical protein